MDQADFDPYEIDTDGLPLVYNEERIASFWKGKPGKHASCYHLATSSPLTPRVLRAYVLAGELTSRWARFAAVSGM